MIIRFSKDPTNPLIPHFDCPNCGKVFDDLSSDPTQKMDCDFTCQECGKYFHVSRKPWPKYVSTPF